jgi:hypothetical protein
MRASLDAVDQCGMLGGGLISLHCGGRRHDKLVAFS